jgi:hypothetical protein
MRRPLSSSIAGSLMVLGAIVAAPPARADTPDASRSAEAERLFREGRGLVSSGDFAHACPKFAESERLDPAPGTLLSLADCEEHQKKLREASEHYRLAASGFPKRDPRRAFATGRAEALEKRLAHLVLRLPDGAPEGTVVRVDGETVPPAALGTASAANPGTVEIDVSAPGRRDKALTLTLAEGETRAVTCELGPPEAPAPIAGVGATPTPARSTPPATARDAAPPARAKDLRRPVSYALLGVGAASLAVGGVAGVLALGKASTVKDHCTGDYACDQEGVDAAASGRFLSPLSTITLIAGAALVGAGVYFFVTSHARHKTPASASLVAPPALFPFRGSF